MKEYTLVIVDLATGDSTVLKDLPDFNSRTNRAFQSLTQPWPGEPQKQWRPIAVQPMGEVIDQRISSVTTSLHRSALVLLERDCC